MPAIPAKHIENAAPRSSDAGVLGYAWRLVGGYQLVAAFLAILYSASALAPIELERRIIDGIVQRAPIQQILWLGALFVALVFAQQAVKFVLGVLQDWMAASIAASSRRELMDVYEASRKTPRERGRAVDVVIAETTDLSQFVGVGFSSAAADLALFAGIAAYMAFVEARIALLGAVFFVPQLVFAQLAQIYLNRINADQVAMLREAADMVLAPGKGDRDDLLRRISANQVRISIVSHILKSVRNLLITLPSIAALVYGGWLVLGGHTTIGTVVAFVSGFRRVSDPVRDLLEFYVYAEWARVQHRLTAQWFEARRASNAGS